MEHEHEWVTTCDGETHTEVCSVKNCHAERHVGSCEEAGTWSEE